MRTRDIIRLAKRNTSKLPGKWVFLKNSVSIRFMNNETKYCPLEAAMLPYKKAFFVADKRLSISRERVYKIANASDGVSGKIRNQIIDILAPEHVEDCWAEMGDL